jgi:hypothetical protein
LTTAQRSPTKAEKVASPTPPDDPHQRRGNVAIGILASAKSGGHGQNEYAGGYELEQRQENRMGEPSPERMSQEIDARIAARTRRMTGKEPDDDKRQDDGCGRAEQIEGKR